MKKSVHDAPISKKTDYSTTDEPTVPAPLTHHLPRSPPSEQEHSHLSTQESCVQNTNSSQRTELTIGKLSPLLRSSPEPQMHHHQHLQPTTITDDPTSFMQSRPQSLGLGFPPGADSEPLHDSGVTSSTVAFAEHHSTALHSSSTSNAPSLSPTIASPDSPVHDSRPSLTPEIFSHHILPFLPFRYLQHNLFLSKRIMLDGLALLDINCISLVELYMMKKMGLLSLPEQPAREHKQLTCAENSPAPSKPLHHHTLNSMQEQLSTLVDSGGTDHSNSQERTPAHSQDSTSPLTPSPAEEESEQGHLIPIFTRQYMKCHKLTAASRHRLDQYVRIITQVPPLRIEHIDPRYHQDEEIILAAVNHDANIFMDLPVEMKQRSSIVLSALDKSGFVLRFIQHENQTKEMVLRAVSSKGLALKHAAPEFCRMKDVVLCALQENGHAIRFVDPVLQSDLEIAMAAVRSNGKVLSELPHFSSNRQVVNEAILQNGVSLQFADVSLRRDASLVFEAVSQNGAALQFADTSLKKNRDIVKEAVKQDAKFIQFAHDSLQKDEDVLESRVTFTYC